MANDMKELTQSRREVASVKELARQCREMADANGFQAPSWEGNFVHKTAYAITELDEAVDFVHGVTGPGGDPLDEELADTAIRILDLLGGIWGDDWCSRVESRRPSVMRPAHTFERLEVIVWPILGHLAKALEAYRHEDQGAAQQRLELALLECFRVADRAGVDLLSAIEAKIEKNRGRAKLHGKARSEG